MKKIIVLILIFLLTSTNLFALTGEYKITEASTPEGKRYDGTVEIDEAGGAYVINWKLSGVGGQYKGIGILKDDILSVAWGAGKTAGVVSYKVEGKKLIGTWAMLPSGRIGKETLEKQD